MNPFVRLDNLLLKGTQWVVDRIGGDYMGQRLGRQIGIGSYLLSGVSICADYRFPPLYAGLGLFSCVLCAVIIYLNTQEAMNAIHKGFANPIGAGSSLMILRLWMVFLSALPWGPPSDIMRFARDILCVLVAVAWYLISTENPPPKKAKQADEVGHLNVAPQES